VETGREVSGTRRDEQFVEFWSFHRRHGATTRSRGGSIEGQCPQCGSPLNVVDKAQCPSCSAWVNSAEHDWVLAEITQQSEWNLPGDETTTPGVAAIRQRDPHFSVQHLEDRASVMFWRLRAAEFYQEIGYARPVIAHDADELAHQIAERIDGKESVQEPAVGLVDLIDVHSESDIEMARVKIRWSGTKQRLRSSGKQQMLHHKAIYTEVYTLVRQANVTSGSQQTFATASCGECGAPLGVNRDESCQFCGTPLTDGRQDWVLADVSSFTANLNRYSEHLQSRYEQTNRANALAAAGHTPHADRELDLAIIARVLTNDGELTKREVRAFRRLADREGITPDEADLMLSNARTIDVPLPIPENGQEAKLQLEQVAYATLIDGRLTRAEKKLLSRYATHFDLSAADVKLVVRDTQSRMYREARVQHNGKA
ncbi:MAG: hypothetical protein KDA93_27145, partial [Planctomycetaceae bacterium]|nr:hypothetical protein [Planctomycetaceae bacterium]